MDGKVSCSWFVYFFSFVCREKGRSNPEYIL
jgi:hypothetical protein